MPKGGNFGQTSTGAGGSDIGCHVYNNADQNVSNSAATQLAFNTERYDTDTMHAAGDNTKITFTTAGKYIVGCNIQWDTNGTGQRWLYLKLNGTTYIGRVLKTAINGTRTGQGLVVTYEFSATDYVEVEVLQNSGTTREVWYNADESPNFWAQKIDAGG